MLAGVVGVISSIGVVASLVLILWQIRLLTRTRISNEVGSTAAAYSALERIHQVSQIMIDRPETQPYFYENIALPSDRAERDRVLMIAQIMADTIDYGLMVCDLLLRMAYSPGAGQLLPSVP